MLAVDLPVAMLAIGLLTLAFMRVWPTQLELLAKRGLPRLRHGAQQLRASRPAGQPGWLDRWRRRSAPTTPEPPAPVVEATYRRVITGSPARLPETPPSPNDALTRVAGTRVTGQSAAAPDGPRRHRNEREVTAAHAMIDHYFDHEPRQTANLLQRWIDDDRPGAANR